jgi:hypothetical protein
MIRNATMDDWRWLIDVNLWGVIHGVKVFLPILLVNADGGHLKPEEAAPFVTAAIRRGDLYVTSHPEIADLVERRMIRVVQAFRHSSTR